MKPNKIILKDSTKKIQVFVTSYHSTQRIRQEIIIKENQPVNFFGIDFVLRKGILYAKRNKEEKTFFFSWIILYRHISYRWDMGVG